ncbi:MAG: DNA adenine methylase [Proteobacteria bacterium]|nr:DNA adenine methylase [Pseudomonadota bacterium]MBU1057977.1 DNA adenine methylase [Pseudomonadota bacterium]
MGSIIPYFGGKSRLAKTIISKFPDHDCYVEVFAGGASVFFSKDPSKTEILNDLDKDLVTLYRVIKHHPEELHRQFKFSLVARSEFDRKQKIDPETLTDIQRAAHYLYLQRTAFGGFCTKQTYGISTTGKPRLNLLTLQTTLELAWQRLAHVQIESKDFRELIPRYDRPHTLFFLDPPYWKIPGYKHDFEEQDFLDLAQILATIKGKFLMTLNDTPETREIFAPFNIETTTLKYSIATTKKARNKTRSELLISNYKTT